MAPAKGPAEDEPDAGSPCRTPLPDDLEELPFSPGVLFSTLAKPSSRFVLYLLVKTEGLATLSGIASTVAAFEHGCSVDEVSDESLHRAEARLYHYHLSRLEDEGFVDFDPHTGKVKATDKLETVEPYLRVAQAAEPDEWERFCGLLHGGNSTGGDRD